MQLVHAGEGFGSRQGPRLRLTLNRESRVHALDGHLPKLLLLRELVPAELLVKSVVIRDIVEFYT